MGSFKYNNSFDHAYQQNNLTISCVPYLWEVELRHREFKQLDQEHTSNIMEVIAWIHGLKLMNENSNIIARTKEEKKNKNTLQGSQTLLNYVCLHNN